MNVCQIFYPLQWFLSWFAAALLGPAAAPAPVCEPRQTERRPPAADRRPATAGSSQEPEEENHRSYNESLFFFL